VQHAQYLLLILLCALLKYYLLLADIKCGSWSALRFAVAKGEDGVPVLSLLSKWLNTRGTCSDIDLVTGLEVGVLASLFLFPYRDRSLLPRLWTNTNDMKLCIHKYTALDHIVYMKLQLVMTMEICTIPYYKKPPPQYLHGMFSTTGSIRYKAV